jgi:hypothetical protein
LLETSLVKSTDISVYRSLSTRSSHSVTLTEETLEIWEPLLTLSPPQQGENAEEISKTYELFIYGYVHYVTNSLCKNALKIETT